MRENGQWAPAALWTAALVLAGLFILSLVGNGAWLGAPGVAWVTALATLLFGLGAYAAVLVAARRTKPGNDGVPR